MCRTPAKDSPFRTWIYCVHVPVQKGTVQKLNQSINGGSTMKTIVFYDASIPFLGTRPNPADLEVLGRGATICTRDSLPGALDQADRGATLLWLQGAHVPGEVWPAVLSFLSRGNGLLSLGLHPFSQALQGGESCPQASFFRDLSIHEELEAQWEQSATRAPSKSLASVDIPWLSGFESIFTTGNPCSGLVLMPTKNADCPGENGSSGSMDAFIHRLVSYHQEDGRPIAAPAVLIERSRGSFPGGLWAFLTINPDAAFWANGGVKALLSLSPILARGARETWIKPDFALFYPGERPALSISTEALASLAEGKAQARLQVRHESRVVHEDNFELVYGAYQDSRHLILPFEVEPGLYTLSLSLAFPDGSKRQYEQGFWGNDTKVLEQGTRLRAGKDYLERSGKPFPVVGMTYMASDVHRKFLELPNVALWDRDLATMKSLGINYIRTGVWTAYRQVAFMDGQVREGFLRAVDAFILCTSRHDLECCFNFFAFTPEAWDGLNPWLDPRSLAAQKRYLAAVVARHRKTTRVHWDLINEPSMFDPKRAFQGPRTLRDPYETAAFISWLKTENPDLAYWRKRWDKTPASLPDWSAVLPPMVEETGFGTTESRVREHGIWLDYTLFSNAAFAGWATEMAGFIRSLSPDAMVTVGQDEGLGSQRPANQFFEESLDYTNIHNWWINDGLAWDTIFTKVGHKPNLIQETGIMHVEDPQGRSRRTETELAELLERKYAYSFSSAGAGAVHWIWNINYHMDNNNESHIGACRADGSHKPEVNVSADFGKFFASIAPELQGRELEDIAVMYPFSNDYGVRRSAVEATLRLTRVLAYELKLPFRAVGEYQLASLKTNPPRVLILPSPQVISRQARLAVKDFLAHNAATVILTGPADLDENWLTLVPGEEAELVSGSRALNPAREEELILAEDKKQRVVFSMDKLATVKKGNGNPGVRTVPHGKGKLLWCPLPLELNDRTEALAAFYEHTIPAWKTSRGFDWLSGPQPGIFAQCLQFTGGTLHILVNESSVQETLSFGMTRSGKKLVYTLVLDSGRAGLFFTDHEGMVVQSLRDLKVGVREA